MVVAKSAGSFLGGIFNNPGIIAIAAIGITLFIFKDRISEFFAGLKFPEFPDITFPEFPAFPEFPDITFPEFPDFGSFFDNFFNGNGEEPPFTEEPTEEPTELPGGPGIGPVEFPPGCFVNSLGQLDCPTPPTFDVCKENPELCEPESIPEPGDDDFIGPVQPDEPFSLDNFFQDTPPIQPPFMPPVDLPPGFSGGGPSFEGGTIFETNDCFLSLNQLIEKYGVSASQAADIKAQACTAEPGFQPTDFPEEFEFGTSTGSGIFGPPTGEENIVTGGATLESEEKKAACVTCELFGLNCPICAGTI